MEQGSLSFMVSALESEYGVQISKQALDERFHEKCVSYVKAVLNELLQELFEGLYSRMLLPDFEGILIKDSTKFMVPSTLSNNYKSCGGDARSRSQACMSVQYEYDLKSGKITDLSITSGNRNDRKDAGETASRIEKGNLIIRDLGYYFTFVFEECIKQGAYFLSRLDSSTHVFDSSGQQISLKQIYHSMQKSGTTEKELDVLLGSKTRVPARLYLQLVPEEVYAKRIRDKTAKSSGQGRGQLTEETKIRSRFNLFITNAEKKQLPASMFTVLYRLRWQIELQFKIWKSVFKIERLQKMKEARYLVMLYIKLILIVVSLQITYSMQQSLFLRQSEGDKNKIISLNKVLKTLNAMSDKIMLLFRGSGRQAANTAEYICNKLTKHHWLEKKKGKLCLAEILELLYIDISQN
jgi:hypothetical protein